MWANAGVPDPQTYDDHARGTFHILQACAELDVGRARAAFGYDPVFHWSETQQFPED
jgi:hypothetical protein